MTLTSQQIADLTAAKKAADADPTAANIAAYYSVLESAGIAYGTMAKPSDTGLQSAIAADWHQ